ncbi:MAG TPA: PRC-barrel domain-containing protein [Thermomicrobiales bacterium]|nr:PRC-barrel domain-containing protein [Thermomicrobiales bacterium]
MNVSRTIDLGVDVVGIDGVKIGVVDSVVVDPTTGEEQSIVVRKGLLFPTDRILPAQLIQRVDDDGVMVSISSGDASDLPEYLDANYVWPPAGFYGQVGYMWPAASVYTTRTSDLIVDEHIHQRDPDAIILSEGTLVVDRNDDDLGHITEIASDERGRVAGFKVEQGLFRRHEHYIPAHFIERADDRVVRLSIDKQSLEGITAPGDIEADSANV